MFQRPARSIRRTFFFCRTTSSLAACEAFKYALTVVDVASCYKEAEPLTFDADEVAQAFQKIYKCGPLKWPEMQVDPRCEFMGAVTKEMDKHKTFIRHGRVDIHRD